MQTFRIRIQAHFTASHSNTYNESSLYLVELPGPATAAQILNKLREISAIKDYVSEYSIPANADAMPVITSSLNDQGEFSISLPSTKITEQAFTIVIVQ